MHAMIEAFRDGGFAFPTFQFVWISTLGINHGCNLDYHTTSSRKGHHVRVGTVELD